MIINLSKFEMEENKWHGFTIIGKAHPRNKNLIIYETYVYKQGKELEEAIKKAEKEQGHDGTGNKILVVETLKKVGKYTKDIRVEKAKEEKRQRIKKAMEEDDKYRFRH